MKVCPVRKSAELTTRVRREVALLRSLCRTGANEGMHIDAFFADWACISPNTEEV